jgi:import inner membrane translocase subunit TIM21
LSLHPPRPAQPIIWRALSSDTKPEPSKYDADDDNDKKEIVLTPGQQVVAASRLGLWVSIGVFACACAYYIGKELIPTKMSPNTVFNGATKLVSRRYGESLKLYGKDHGGHREGRRNFINIQIRRMGRIERAGDSIWKAN